MSANCCWFNSTTVGIQYFRNFLTREANRVQYILCWVEVELFKVRICWPFTVFTFLYSGFA